MTESFLVKVKDAIYENKDGTDEQIRVFITTMLAFSAKQTSAGPIIKRSTHEAIQIKRLAQRIDLKINSLKKESITSIFLLFDLTDKTSTTNGIQDHVSIDALVEFVKTTSDADNVGSTHHPFLAGIFVMKGSINNPEAKHTHLELRIKDEKASNFVKELLIQLGISINTFVRGKSEHIVIKNKKAIPDFLKLINSNNAMYDFENIRSSKDFLVRLRRFEKIDEMNSNKRSVLNEKFTYKVNALMQSKKFSKMKSELIEISEIKIENPELSFAELAEKYNEKHNTNITKSAVSHGITEILNHDK